MTASTRATLAIAALSATLLIALGVRLWIGGGGETPEITEQIMAVRQTRVGTGIVVGAALAVSGVLLQALLRNPLASPDLLGLASGAGLGIMTIVFVGYHAGLGIAATHLGSGAGVGWSTTTAAIAGAFAALASVYALSQRRGLLDPVTLVLVGVVISLMCGAATGLLKSLMPDQGLAASRLLMGTLSDDTPAAQLWLIAALTLVSTGAAAYFGPAMDAASLADDEASSVGVRLRPLRALLFALAGILAAASVVLAGPIGFVGLICPHVARLLAGPSHRILVVAAAIAGAALVVAADAACRLIDFGSGHPPISILTSLLGGPLLIVLLRQARSAP